MLANIASYDNTFFNWFYYRNVIFYAGNVQIGARFRGQIPPSEMHGKIIRSHVLEMVHPRAKWGWPCSAVVDKWTYVQYGWVTFDEIYPARFVLTQPEVACFFRQHLLFQNTLLMCLLDGFYLSEAGTVDFERYCQRDGALLERIPVFSTCSLGGFWLVDTTLKQWLSPFCKSHTENSSGMTLPACCRQGGKRLDSSSPTSNSRNSSKNHELIPGRFRSYYVCKRWIGHLYGNGLVTSRVVCILLVMCHVIERIVRW